MKEAPAGGRAVSSTALDLPLYSRGKVRDVYDLGDRLLIVATDRLSAFDCVLPTAIPDRGRVLTGLSAFWFERLAPVTATHYLTIDPREFPAVLAPHRSDLAGRAMLVRRCRRIDFECVVRGYLAGSAWREYRDTGRVGGVDLPPGLTLGSRLPEPMFTPATKAETGHDENVTTREMAARIGATLADRLERTSLALYREAARVSEEAGFILVDTKFEFGLDVDGVVLIDEAVTPDSSRFWDAAAWALTGSTDGFDKQVVRDYLDRTGWDRTPPAPELPARVIDETRARYLEVYRRLTGRHLSEA
jgi:phosphoribosylaminoimidazole-succinocarboxamide synthase